MKREACPNCGSGRNKKNGHIHNGKQNYRCKDCGRQFVGDCEHKTIGEETKELIKRALLERNSLRGICRIFGVSLTWLLGYIAELYGALPTDLSLGPQAHRSGFAPVHLVTVEADEMWSFVFRKADKQWIWIALDARTRQVIAFHVGDRSKESARQLWEKIPDAYRKHATFYTDLYDSYVDVIPKGQHLQVVKQTGLTSHIERFNCTMRQRVSRLVRDSLAFSKKLANHVGAIHYFICHYNQNRKPAALHV